MHDLLLRPIPTLLCRPQGGLNDMLHQVELCRRYAEKHGLRLIVDTQGVVQSCLPLRFGRVFQMQRCGCPVATGLSSQEARRLDGMATHPRQLQGAISRRMELRDPIKLDFAQPPAAPLLVHVSWGGGDGAHAMIRRRQLRVNPAFLEDHAARWRAFIGRVRALGAYDAVHIRHTDYRTTTYPSVLEAVFSGPAASVLVCSDNPGVLAHAADFARFHGKRLVTTADLLEGGFIAEAARPSAEARAEAARPSAEPAAATAPLHYGARRLTDADAELHVLKLLADMYALSGAEGLRIMTPDMHKDKPLHLARPAGFSRLVRFLNSDPAARGAFFCEE